MELATLVRARGGEFLPRIFLKPVGWTGGSQLVARPGRKFVWVMFFSRDPGALFIHAKRSAITSECATRGSSRAIKHSRGTSQTRREEATRRLTPANKHRSQLTQYIRGLSTNRKRTGSITIGGSSEWPFRTLASPRNATHFSTQNFGQRVCV